MVIYQRLVFQTLTCIRNESRYQVRLNLLVLVARAQRLLFLRGGGWPKGFDPRARRNLTIYSSRSTKQANLASSHVGFQLTLVIDIIQSRFRHRQKQTPFQQNLEKLKKRKLRITESSDEQSGDGDSHASPEPFEDSQKDGQIGDPGEGDDDDIEVEDDDIDDFVVEDDGVAIPELPVAFSRRAHQDSSHDFKVVCQLFVHLAMMPVGGRRSFMEQILKGDDYFLVPFQVIRRKLSGAKDSVASSVWRRDYKEVLERFPDLTLTKLDFSTFYCDACRVRKKSTVAGWLKGIPYDKLSFEPIIDERDSEEPDDEDRHSTSLSLGRFCAIRTQIYHRLTHWSVSRLENGWWVDAGL
jgi:hypothetical protein